MALQWVLLICLLYVGFLFLTAWWVDRRTGRGNNIVANPYVYSLSLAVYCTAWTFFGSVGRASVSGLSFLTTYLGPVLAVPLWWLVLRKMILISKQQRITSIADFISARYGKSTLLGVVVTLIAVLGIVPYISIQLKAIAAGIDVLTGLPHAYRQAGVPVWQDVAFWSAVSLALFTGLFGTRKLDPNEQHEGLTAAIAFESMVKLLAFLIVGFFITFHLYDGFGDVFARAAVEPNTRRLLRLSDSGVTPFSWTMLMLLSGLAIFLLPRQFHMGVVENTRPGHVRTAMWLFPLYLLLINIFVMPIALAGRLELGDTVDPDTYVLSVPLAHGARGIALLAFMGGFSAATSMVIVSTTALSIMLSNHVVVPLLLRGSILGREPHVGASARLLDIRRVSIIGVLLLAYAYLRAVSGSYSLVSVGLTSFTAVAQFAPAALGGMYWKRATRAGAMAGLITGFCIWAFTLPLPIIADAGFLARHFETEGLLGCRLLRPHALFGLEGLDPVGHSAFWSLLFNCLMYACVSLWTRPNTLSITQADLFVNIYRYVGDSSFYPVDRRAATKDVLQVLNRFLGDERCLQLVQEFERRHEKSLGQAGFAPAEFIRFAETHLAGAIGSASARLVMENIVQEEPISSEQVMQVLERTQEVLRYSKELEWHSAQLEIATKQLSNANKRLKELDQMKAEFITTVTHELRTPITSIKAWSKILLDYRDTLSEAQKVEYLQILITESDRIARLINQVLDLEKLTYIQKTDNQPIPIGALVQSVYTTMIPLMEGKGIEHRLLLPENEVEVSGQSDQLKQILLNLLSNAIKFVPATGGAITVAVHADAENRLANVQVKDNGPGVPAALQEHIFEKFTQVSTAESGKPDGSGLGLHISRLIAEQHGGTLRVNSRAGEGAEFVLALPTMA
ncbi:MAG: sensor histidine kinase [Saprospiraceae bacterium]|nr:sensor histidine kinase [Saprospiraceae bacterium]